MFATSTKRAAEFTRPVATCVRRLDGTIETMVGASVLLNKAGWIVTAYHLIEGGATFEEDAAKLAELKRSFADPDGVPSVADGRLVTDRATWWGEPGLKFENLEIVEELDLVIGQLVPPIPDPAMFSHPAKIKDPKNVELGASLCRLGYPFEDMGGVQFDNTTHGFDLPTSAFKAASPSDGLLVNTRAISAATDYPFALKTLELSSAGLRGQSGGPIYDRDGVVWGVQIKMEPWTYDFDLPRNHGSGSNHDPSDGHAKKDRLSHSHFVGVGVHAETLVGLLRDLRVDYTPG